MDTLLRSRLAATVAAIALAGSATTATAHAAEHRPGLPTQPYDLTFTSGPDTLPATFLPADHTSCDHSVHPAALIISGSGDADRNGNGLLDPHSDTNLNFAKALAADRISSLRYDKFGTGQAERPGPGHHPGGAGIDFTMYAQEALDAWRTLATQPGVDPHRLILVGHSEGGLFALWLADHLKGTPLAPRAVVLAAPLSTRYLDHITDQYTRAYRGALADGQMDQATYDLLTTQLTAAVATIRTTRTAPTGLLDQGLKRLLQPAYIPFWVQADAYDPAALAHDLGRTEPVLVLHGTADQVITSPEIEHLMTGLRRDRAARHAEIPQADHLFKTGTDDSTFATLAARRLAEFVQKNLF